jgi:hypothetical protein
VVADTRLKDGDDEPEIGVQIIEPSELDVCTWTKDVDEKRRAFVVNQIANADIDGEQLVKNMHAVCEWLKTGQPAGKTETKPAPVAVRGGVRIVE